MSKNVVVFSQQGFQSHYGLKSLLGKKVISSKGVILGRVKDVGFTSKRVLGIYVGKLFRKYFVAMEYIDEFDGDAVMLRIEPVTILKGKLVFDKDGQKVGKVTEIKRASFANELSAVYVKKNIFRKPIKVSSDSLEIVEKNIILNCTIDDGTKK
ncbi:MAG: PRC-barrel domain-containing protein [Candidatus Nanoarchaeia archaeon]